MCLRRLHRHFGVPGGLKVYLGSIDSVQWTPRQTPDDSSGFCANGTGEKNSISTRIVRTANDTWTISADSFDLRSDVGALFTETSGG